MKQWFHAKTNVLLSFYYNQSVSDGFSFCLCLWLVYNVLGHNLMKCIIVLSLYHGRGILAGQLLLWDGWCPSGLAGSEVHSEAAFSATGWPPLPLGPSLALDEREVDDE